MSTLALQTQKQVQSKHFRKIIPSIFPCSPMNHVSWVSIPPRAQSLRTVNKYPIDAGASKCSRDITARNHLPVHSNWKSERYSKNHRESLEFWVEDLPTAHTRPLPLIESRLQSIRFLHGSRHREISLMLWSSISKLEMQWSVFRISQSKKTLRNISFGELAKRLREDWQRRHCLRSYWSVELPLPVPHTY